MASRCFRAGDGSSFVYVAGSTKQRRCVRDVVPPSLVRLRVVTERGRPSVKIGASEQSSGISLAGPTGTKDTYAILEANANISSLKLRAEDGREQVIKP